jgi:hypothetical protein
MQAKAIAVAAVVAVLALSGSPLSASAAECFRGTVATTTGPALLKGCMVRKHYVSRAPRRTVTTTTRTVTHDYWVTTSRPYTTTVTRDSYYSVPVTRDWDEDAYYGSSYPAVPRYYEPMGY